MSTYTNAAFNAQKNITVKWNLESGRFVIEGDSRKVTNKTLQAMMFGDMPKGWSKAPATIEEILAAGNAA